ncbi:peptide/nickel transport system substrate-binding protein [Pseudonocardia thermophila]|jgi:ABC-type dipeptide transport system, periplasmic component|uniref:Peptide/nickel transport system substrate-binding protein n=1 Tax=Pseudonocardia thermophila TaxID=1848 RepID=A0A1M6ZXE4_PSETH|nr:ABC transporter substrate-binding protein [Pseudonocardia thermophila]SHL35151.1 peptide/nickel transport system substrate-binding protein [Pseudonocardia thermophila]
MTRRALARAARSGPSWRRKAGPVAVLAATALAVTACGGGGGSQSSAAAGGTTFTYAISGLPTSLDPADHQGDPSRNIGFELGGTLFRWGTEDLDQQGCTTLASVDHLKGDLAESWERSADGKTVTVKLREATSAAGNKLTSEDVKWTFDRLIDLKVGTPNTLMQDVADYAADPIRVIDDRTFEIHMDNPSAMDLAILTWYQFRILDSTEVKKHVTADDPWGKNFVSKNASTFGPWTHAESDFVSGDRLTLSKNPNYTAERGDVEKLVFIGVSDAASRAQLLSTGNASYAAGLAYEQYAQLRDNPAIDVQTCVSADRIPLVLNAADPVLGKDEVRKAISLAIDRKSIVDAVYRGFNQPAEASVSTAYGVEMPEAAKYRYDVEEAKRLLEQAGVSNLSMTLHISPARPGPEAEQIAILLQNQLSKVGIDVKIQTLASATEINTVFHDGNFQALLYLEPPAVADPYYSLFLYNSSKSKLNTFGYVNSEYDDVVAKVGTTSPGDERDALVKRAGELLAEHPGFIYLVDRQFVHAVRTGLTNYQHAPNGEMFVHTLKQG